MCSITPLNETGSEDEVELQFSRLPPSCDEGNLLFRCVVPRTAQRVDGNVLVDVARVPITSIFVHPHLAV